MKKCAVKWISREIIVSPLYIGICFREKDFYTELTELKVPESHWPPWVKRGKDAQVHYFERLRGHGNCCIVCVRNRSKRDSVEVMGLLIHEAVHLWQHIKIDIGEVCPSPEFEAYSIQHIAQQLIAATISSERKKR